MGRASGAATSTACAVDAATNTIVAAILTTSSEGDAGQVGPLLDQTEGPIDTVMADGACDGEPTYQTAARQDPTTTVVIPPRSRRCWDQGPSQLSVIATSSPLPTRAG
jgi:transposase